MKKYIIAKDIADSLYKFPYQSPEDVPVAVKHCDDIFNIIKKTYPTTIGQDGKSQQTTILPAERIYLQSIFKDNIYFILEKCISEYPDHTAAMLLYGKVAVFNTRAKDRESLIKLYERFLPIVENTTNGSSAYMFIQDDIADLGGNCFDKVERHLADFHYELAKLYHQSNETDLAKIEYKKSCKLCSKIYGARAGKISLF